MLLMAYRAVRMCDENAASFPLTGEKGKLAIQPCLMFPSDWADVRVYA